MLYAIPYPVVDPVLVEFGPLVIRWYALAYIAGLLGGWWYVRRLVAARPHPLDPDLVDDLLLWATLGVILGGRLGYVLFYNPAYFLANPLEIPAVWQGGMAFHGGFLGVCVAVALFARRRGVPLLKLADGVACAAPIGLFLGRLANFINAELWGRRAPDVPWSMVFPGAGPVPRHPSQLYEAGLEGLLLFALLGLAWRMPAVRGRFGVLVGLFLMGYGVARSLAELFRQPDAHLGFLAGGLTMGQMLSAPMILAGLLLAGWAWRRGPA